MAESGRLVQKAAKVMTTTSIRSRETDSSGISVPPWPHSQVVVSFSFLGAVSLHLSK